MDSEQLKSAAMRAIDAHRRDIVGIGREIYDHPETGFKEIHATKTLADAFEALGLSVERDIAVTGCRAFANPDADGPKIAVLGELDSVVCPEHPDCDRETGAVHACGHNIQTAVMYGVAMALTRSGILGELGGKIDFMATPAEEYIQLDFRNRLKEAKAIRYFSGKAELIRRGAFDDVDLAAMIHAFPIAADGWKCAPMNTGNGFIGKTVRFIGRQAHAGAAPWDGVNALNMSAIAITGMQMQRETFREADRVRIHQIVTKGGDIVNSVPADVRMETCVRASNLPALREANEKVNRSIHGAAVILGGRAEVVDTPGQLPLQADAGLAELFMDNALDFYRRDQILPCLESTASFDMGDVSQIMPVLHGVTSGIAGGLHSKDYRIVDEEDAYIVPTKILTGVIIDLLRDKAKKARETIKAFKPPMTREEYLECMDDMERVFSY